MTQAVRSAPKADATGKNAAPVMVRPFRIGAQVTDDEVYDNTLTTIAGTQRFPIYNVPSTAYLKDIYVYAVGTTAGNAATVVYAADGPFNVIDTIKFTDTNNAEILTPMTGWDLYIIDKFGGYSFSDDAKLSPTFSAVAGVGAGLGGSFAFILRIPIELVPRDALGALVNKSQSTPYRVSVTLAATNTVYTTAPTTPPSVRLRMTPVNYWEPTATDGSGNPVAKDPPGLGTTQYWNVTPYTVAAGAMSQSLSSSVGYPLRNLIFVLRDSTLTRAGGETDWPDPFKLQLQSNFIVDRVKALWQHRIAQDYGYTGAVGDTAGSKDNGVYNLPYNNDFSQKPGWENRRAYLRTTDGMRLKALGTIGGSGTHTLTVYTNYVGVGAGITLAQLTT
jgi:hypothetical protein